MARHIEIASALVTTKVYLCDPHSWQCPSKENVSGVLRDYLPIGTDLFRPLRRDIALVQAELNQRTCKVLAWTARRPGWLRCSEHRSC